MAKLLGFFQIFITAVINAKMSLSSDFTLNSGHKIPLIGCKIFNYSPLVRLRV